MKDEREKRVVLVLSPNDQFRSLYYTILAPKSKESVPTTSPNS